MRFFFHPEADKEFQESIRYYEDCRSGLGLEFAEEIYVRGGQRSDRPTIWVAGISPPYRFVRYEVVE